LGNGAATQKAASMGCMFGFSTCEL